MASIHDFFLNFLREDKRAYLLIGLVGAFLYLPFLGGIQLFDWDEINFAECSREMIISGNYSQVQMNFEAFWEKPPLFFWLQAIAMKVFGIGEYAARFPNAIAGILTLLFLFYAGKQWISRSFAWFWVLAYLGSTLPFLYFKSGIIDPFFNLFTFASLFLFVEAGKKHNSQILYGLGSGILLGLAILTKGPAAPLMMLLTFGVMWLLHKRNQALPLHLLGLTSLGTLIPPMLWFGMETAQNGFWFIETFIRYQIRLFSTPDAGHGGFPGYHLVVLLLGCFPASLFAIPAFKKRPSDTDHTAELKKWMLALFWVVVILFSIVQSKIVHYSSLAYFPLTFLSAYSLYLAHKRKVALQPIIIGLLALISLVYFLLPLLLVFLVKNPAYLSFVKDPFAMQQLQAAVNWSGWEGLVGIWVIIGFILFYRYYRKGFITMSVTFLFGMNLLFINSALFLFSGKIQQHTQGALVEFFSSHAKEDCYFRPLFKTYTPYFYGKVSPGRKVPEGKGEKWLLEGDIDKDVYFVRRIHQATWMEDYSPTIKELYRKNGFVFYKREKLH